MGFTHINFTRHAKLSAAHYDDDIPVDMEKMESLAAGTWGQNMPIYTSFGQTYPPNTIVLTGL